MDHQSTFIYFKSFYENAMCLPVELGFRPGTASLFGEFDLPVASNPLPLGSIYGQHAFVSCHRCPQMAKLNMPPKSCEREACLSSLGRVSKSVFHSCEWW